MHFHIFLAQYLLIQRLEAVVTFFPDPTNTGLVNAAADGDAAQLFPTIERSVEQYDHWMLAALIVKHACTVLLNNTNKQF